MAASSPSPSVPQNEPAPPASLLFSAKEYSRPAAYFLLIVLGMIALKAGSADLPLVDRDEPRFTQATREMIEREEWFVPYFNDEYRFDKPVMIYWLMRGAFAVVGDCELAARLPSIVTAILIALILYEMGRSRWTETLGFWAGAMWLTTLQVLLHGRLAVADMPMVLAVVLSQWALLELLLAKEGPDKAKGWGWFWLLWLAQAFGFLSKGPIALLAPALSLLLFRFALWRKPLPWGRLRVHLGLPVALVLVAAWGVPALVQTGGEFWNVGMGTHVVERGVGSFNGRMFLPVYYLISSFLSLFPWILFLGWAWQAIRARWSAEVAFLLAWIGGPYLIFSFYATQLPHYVMPAFPAFLLLLAMGMEENRPPLWGKILFWIVATVFAVVGTGLIALALLETFPPALARMDRILSGIGACVLCLLAMALLMRYGMGRVAVLPAIGISMSLSMAFGPMASLVPSANLAPALAALAKDGRAYFLGYEEPSLVYYANRHWDKLNPADWSRLARDPQTRAFVILTHETKLDDYLATRLPFLKKKTRETVSIPPEAEAILHERGFRRMKTAGLNLARTSYVEVEALLAPAPAP